jgi:hypothetical protein
VAAAVAAGALAPVVVATLAAAVPLAIGRAHYAEKTQTFTASPLA